MESNGNISSWQCRVTTGCRSFYETLFELVSHIRSSHPSEVIVCGVEHCQDKFYKPISWYWHIRTVHSHLYCTGKRKRSQCGTVFDGGNGDKLIYMTFTCYVMYINIQKYFHRYYPAPTKVKNSSMFDLCDGSVYKHHPLFKDCPNALQIIVYYDEFTAVNVMSPSDRKHKLGMAICMTIIL